MSENFILAVVDVKKKKMNRLSYDLVYKRTEYLTFVGYQKRTDITTKKRTDILTFRFTNCVTEAEFSKKIHFYVWMDYVTFLKLRFTVLSYVSMLHFLWLKLNYRLRAILRFTGLSYLCKVTFYRFILRFNVTFFLTETELSIPWYSTFYWIILPFYVTFYRYILQKVNLHFNVLSYVLANRPHLTFCCIFQMGDQLFTFCKIFPTFLFFRGWGPLVFQNRGIVFQKWGQFSIMGDRIPKR